MIEQQHGLKTTSNNLQYLPQMILSILFLQLFIFSMQKTQLIYSSFPIFFTLPTIHLFKKYSNQQVKKQKHI